MNRENLISIFSTWLSDHYDYRKKVILNLSISELDAWLKRIDDRWQDDVLGKIEKEDKATLILPEQYSEEEETIRDLIKLLKSHASSDESIKEKAKEFLSARNESESQEERVINDRLYIELERM